MMDTLTTDPEDTSLQKKKAKKFRLFGKKKSQPHQLDPNCPQCNPQLLVALEEQQRQQRLYLQQQQMQYHQQLLLQQQQQQGRVGRLEAGAAGSQAVRQARRDDGAGAIVQDYDEDDEDDDVGASSSRGVAGAGGRVPCGCRKCQQARSERPLTVELLPMDTSVPLQNMMHDAAFMCALL